MTLIGVHEMHGRVLVVDLRSSSTYFMMTHPLPIAGKLPIKTLVARQLPTHTYTHTQSIKQPANLAFSISIYHRSRAATSSFSKTFIL